VNPLRHQAEWVILATAAVTNLGVQYISPLLPAMRSDLHLTTVQIGWIVGGYSLPSLLLTLPLGVAADMWGSKRVLIGSLVLFGISGLGTLTSTTFEQLLVWRILQGIAFAPFATLTISMTAETLPLDVQALAQGYRTVVASASEFVLPVVAGWTLLAGHGWKPAFLLFVVPLGIAVWGVIVLPRSEPRVRTSGLNLGREAAVVMRRADILGVTMGGFARWFLKYGFYAYIPLYLAYEVHAGPAVVGLVIGIPGLMGALSATQSGRFRIQDNGKRALVVALVVFGLSIPGATLFPNIWWAAALTAVQGLADGILGTLLNSYISILPPAQIRVTVVAASGFVRNLGKGIAPGVVGAIVTAAGYRAAFATISVLALAAPAYLLPLLRSSSQVRTARAEVSEASQK
jgi:MFS family permease